MSYNDKETPSVLIPHDAPVDKVLGIQNGQLAWVFNGGAAGATGGNGGAGAIANTGATGAAGATGATGPDGAYVP